MAQIGNPEKAVAAQAQNGVNVAAMIREMELLRKVADTAVELRAAGRACDKIIEGMDEMNAQAVHGHTRCATPAVWANERFQTQMQKFDDAVAEAAKAGFTWAQTSVLGPRRILGEEKPKA